MNTNLKEIQSNFLLFDNQLDKFEYLIEIGKNNKGISEKLKIDKNLIVGCASKSWLICYKKENLFFIDIDSDGDLDLFIGQDYNTSTFPIRGRIYFFRNIGDDNQDIFQFRHL